MFSKYTQSPSSNSGVEKWPKQSGAHVRPQKAAVMTSVEASCYKVTQIDDDAKPKPFLKTILTFTNLFIVAKNMKIRPKMHAFWVAKKVKL